MTFQNSRVELDFGAMVNLTNDHFLANNVYVDATLANSLSGNFFPYGSTVSVLYGRLTTSAGLPRIVNVADYSLAGLYIEGGGSLDIGNQIRSPVRACTSTTTAAAGLAAMGVTFQNSRVELDAGGITASLRHGLLPQQQRVRRCYLGDFPERQHFPRQFDRGRAVRQPDNFRNLAVHQQRHGLFVARPFRRKRQQLSPSPAKTP